MSVTVYGASDDLIEIEGSINEEFNPPYDKPSVLAFSDGTIVSIEYSPHGVWRIAPLAKGSAELDIVQAPANDEDNYSDRAILVGDIRWVVMGMQYVVA